MSREPSRLVGGKSIVEHVSLSTGSSETPAIVRDRLDARFARALAYPIAIVVGPIGSGKTVATSSFLERSDRPYVRYASYAPVVTPIDFVRGLASALVPLAPGAYLSSSIACELAMKSSTPALDLAGWLREHTRGMEPTIFIDDLGDVERTRPIAQLLTTIIEETIPEIRWVIASRDVSLFPVASWLAHRLTDIPVDAPDLCFTLDDALSLRLLRQSALTEPQTAALVEQVRGWPLGMSFGLDTLDDDAAMATIPAERKAAIRHFAARALASLDRADIDLLLRVSLLPDLDPLLVDALDVADAGATLDRLRSVLPTIFAEPRRLRRAVLKELAAMRKRSGSELNEGTAEQAARALERAGRFAEALTLYTDFEDQASIARVLDAFGLPLVDFGRFEIVEAALDQLEGTPFADRPVPLAIRALTQSNLGHYDTAEAWFRLAIAAAAEPGVRTEIAYRFALDAMRRNRPDSVESLVPALALDDIGESPTELGMRATLATAYAATGKRSLAADSIESVLAAIDATVPANIVARIYHQAAFVALRADQFDRARAYALRAIDEAHRSGSFDVVARAQTVLVRIAVDVEDDPIAALAHLEEFARYGAMSGNPQMRIFALCATFDIEVERGNLDAIERLERTLQGRELVQHANAINESLLPNEAMRAAWLGDFDRAYRLIAKTAQTEAAANERALRYAETALFAALSGRNDEARSAFMSSQAEALDVLAEARGGRAPTLLALAALILNEPGKAESLLGAARACGSDQNVRTAVLLQAVETLIAYASKDAGTNDVTEMLEALTAHELGGYRLLMEAIPAERFARV